MRILLIGEYSRLHNSLKEGLVKSGHEVVIVGNGDSFKKYPVDFDTESHVSNSKIMHYPRQIIYRLFGYDFAKLERGIRFWWFSKYFKNYDVVQLINEAPIKTSPLFEKYLLKKIFNNNGKIFLLSSGVDLNNIEFLLKKTLKYSLLNPYFENPSVKNQYAYILEYLKKNHRKLSTFVSENSNGIIASDMDYVLPLINNPKFIGLIPNPINIDLIKPIELKSFEIIRIFLGINKWNRVQKGIIFFEEALNIIQKKYKDQVQIIIAENLPYQQYISSYDACHILLDNVYGYDQGYNALEAMAKGKVVFTGAETEFYNHYQLQNDVCINAIPDTQTIVNQLADLIENPEKISQISKNAIDFIHTEHHYVKVAQEYLEVWKNN